MAAPRRRGEKVRRFEWKVIRIPLTTVNLSVMLLLVVAAGGLLYYYREALPRVRLPGVIRTAMNRIGISLGGAGGVTGAGEADVMERRFASLSFLTGEVKIQRMGEMNWAPAEHKMKLATGDRVRTFGGARAEVLFDDGSVLKIKPDSLIIIGDMTENLRTKVRQSSVRLMVSSIEADIKKSVVEGSRFQLVMPSAVAEMGKARLSVDVGPGQDSRIRIYTGQVAVDTGREKLSVGELSQVSVGPGRVVSAVSQIMPSPKMASPASLSKFMFNDPVKVAVRVEWQPVPKSIAYHLQIDTDRAFERPIVDLVDLKTSAYQAAGLPPSVYYARAAAVDSSGQEGSFSDPLVFMVLLDKVPPEVEVQKFISSKAAGGFDIFVEGITEPAVELNVGGRAVVVDEQGRFSASLRGVQAQDRQISLVARDRAGNQNTLPLKVSGG